MKKEVINSPIRWAGSKKKILNEMLTFFDRNSEIYIEPFLGSGVVLINLINNIEEFNFKKIFVNDINTNIVNFYILLQKDFNFIQKELTKIIKEYNKLDNIKEKEVFYYNIRECFNKLESNEKKKSILFYILMKIGYNGVYRENQKGMFNVPFGKKSIINCDMDKLKEISEKIQKVNFLNYDYKTFFEVVQKEGILEKAFIYFDPPYIPEEKVLNKKQELYTSKGFNHDEFVNFIKKLNKNKLLISMNESPKADEIYHDFRKYKISDILRTINPKKIIKSTEIVFSNFIIKNKYMRK